MYTKWLAQWAEELSSQDDLEKVKHIKNNNLLAEIV